MNRVVALLLLVSGLCVHAAESGITNLVVTPLEVDPKSVTLTGADTLSRYLAIDIEPQGLFVVAGTARGGTVRVETALSWVPGADP